VKGKDSGNPNLNYIICRTNTNTLVLEKLHELFHPKFLGLTMIMTPITHLIERMSGTGAKENAAGR
jgi:hypothetical protein